MGRFEIESDFMFVWEFFSFTLPDKSVNEFPFDIRVDLFPFVI